MRPLKVCLVLFITLLTQNLWSQSAEDPLAVQLANIASSFDATTEPIGPITVGQLAEETSDFLPVDVELGRCYSFLGVAESSGADLDLHLYGEGIELAADIEISGTSTIHWCNHVFERVSLEIRMYSGSGRYALQLFRETETGSSSDDILWAALNALAGRYAEGYLPAAAPVVGELALGQEQSYDVVLAGGRCYIGVGVGEQTVVDIDLFLESPAGALLDSDLRPDAEPVLRYCTPESAGGRFRVRVLMVRGYGRFGFRLFGD